jgi:hypothetical protein
LQYFSYIPHDGQGSSQRSGVYFFRPRFNTTQRVDANPKTNFLEGKHVLLVSTKFGNYIQQNYTLVRKSSELSMDVRSGMLLEIMKSFLASRQISTIKKSLQTTMDWK